ncbi:MAG: sulfur carrier protein ThiS adenylyltransferase ThiF, partial [Lachnospiraceae bacterium]|nr:sulfur carrier protein ThiS adenylyltransferase ThiF [Lachnospiraceae bacterium]
HLLLIDFDSVDVTNLNRQVYMIPHVGMKKTEALKTILEQINPYLDYEFKSVKVTPEMVKDLFSAYPIVCEAFDKPDQKAMLVGELLSQFEDTVVVSGNGMAGYQDANEIVTKQKLRRLYVCGDEHTDVLDGIGLMAPRVTVCAAHQANKVIQIILND